MSDIIENEIPRDAETGETPEPVGIDWSKIDPETIPDTVVKAHPRFQQVLTEAIERRKENKRLKEAASTEEPLKDNTAQSEVAERLANLEARLAEATRQSLRLEAEKETGLRGKILDKITTLDREEFLAEAKQIAADLGIRPKNFDAGVAGGAPVESAQQRGKAVYNKIFPTGGRSNPFDRNTQLSQGGGVVSDFIKK